ncbi:alpha/beta hydrolase family protein [Fimbriiglobus ruber]|uniref:Dipeptidyl aminopeptidase n=1 Tax=Fimbriiglobus ruber TaxID=1908690 RepID=A0A225E6M6_9BACT|nr:alpha/beta hydrolase [Fimbriiglobus ruber]OWK46458.1 dipeptidyl aminopeptidase [Fimbriiglobus ruber]
MATPAKFPFFPDNEEFWFETQRAFGASSYGASEFGEVLATVSRIASGDYEGWHAEWNVTAERVFAEAEAQRAAGHRVSARDGYLRAATYFRTSEFFLHGNPDDPRIQAAYEKATRAYRLGCPLYDTPILPVEIPYEGTTLPGYFHRVDDTEAKRPLFIMHTGFDGSAEEMHNESARAGVERGWNVLVFDGPGQYGPIHRERLPFRPDWENVVTPVVDFALTLPGVDPERIALMGVSFGGYLAPRAAAFERRISALVANDGIYDFGVTQLASVPPDQREAFIAALNQKDAPELDRQIVAGAQRSPSAKWAMDQAGYVMGEPTPHATVAKVLKFNLRDGIAEQIACPTLVLDSEEDLYLKGQPDELFKRLTCPKTLIRFTTAEGAGAHCQVGADRLANARIFDWLDDTFGLTGHR